MATGQIDLPINSADVPDGSANNLAPAVNRQKGTETAPQKHFATADFDWTQLESLWWHRPWPQNYASAPILRLHWKANALTGSAVWGIKIGATSPNDADTPLEHALATASTATTSCNTTEALRMVETLITIANLDSVAVGDEVWIQVFRDGANGSDGLGVDAKLISASIDYTTT